jgi:hypothetical protein
VCAHLTELGVTLSHRGWPGDKGVGQETGVSCINQLSAPTDHHRLCRLARGQAQTGYLGHSTWVAMPGTPNGRLPAGQARPDAVQLVLPDRGACSTGVRASGMAAIGGRTSPKDIQQRSCWARAGVGH